jgi:hypothetical protein
MQQKTLTTNRFNRLGVRGPKLKREREKRKKGGSTSELTNDEAREAFRYTYVYHFSLPLMDNLP